MSELPINQIIQGDCLEVMKDYPNEYVDLIILDPPYNIGKDSWDKIEDYENWLLKVIKTCERVLKRNGSFYLFHSEMPVIARVMVRLEKETKLIFKQFIVWNKYFLGSKNEGYCKMRLSNNQNRNYYDGFTEYILFYTFQDETGLSKIYGDIENFKPIRDYMIEEKQKAGLKTCGQINRLLEVDDGGGGMASHYFSKIGEQWMIPTREMWIKLQSTGFFQKSYESLRQEYESLRQEYESLRYTFNNQRVMVNSFNSQSWNNNVWNYDFVAKKNGHLTEKPLDLIKNIILHSSNEGDVVLDPFLGSGTTAIACEMLGRKWIGIEVKPEYYESSRKRVEHSLLQTHLNIAD